MSYLSILVLFGAYLIGSVPWGFLAGRLHGVDLRTAGSGNIGATNALRVLGKPTGIAVFVLDFLKGVAAVLLAGMFDQPEFVRIACGLLVIVGHNYPVWLGFRGGKGIAATAGVLLALFPWWVFVAGLVVWWSLFFATKIVSVASIGVAIALIAISAGSAVLGEISPLLGTVGCILGALAILRHRSNISRLLAGTEPKFQKKPRAAEGETAG